MRVLLLVVLVSFSIAACGEVRIEPPRFHDNLCASC
jgi:hypothetical protein